MVVVVDTNSLLIANCLLLIVHCSHHSYYKSYNNFLVYSGNGLKSDFDGHDNHHFGNIYAYVDGHCMGICSQLPGHEDMFQNNTCIMLQDGRLRGVECCLGSVLCVVCCVLCVVCCVLCS